MTNNIAAIDLGSNSARLVIADNKGNYLLTLAKQAKLAEGMQKDMLLTPEAKDRTINILTEFSKQVQEHNVKNYRAITTAAVRQSKNGQDFIKEVLDKTNIKFDIIDEIEEARLNLVGAMAHVLGQSKYVCVFDIGGASTEVTIATNEINTKIIKTTSIPYGVRNSSEKFDFVEYNKDNAGKLKEEIISYIKDFTLPDDCITLATSSTALRLAAMVYAHSKYDRQQADGLVLNQEQINNTTKNIYNQKREELANNPCIGENRSYLIVSGLFILQTIVEDLKIKELTASLLSAKDAIIKELINEHN